MSQQLSTFTSIIGLLTLRCPELKQELQCLRQAVTQWDKQVQEQILSKNRAIMAAKTRGTQKLAILFNQIDNFFDNLMKNYSDPNMPIFYRIFLKIKEDFQFIDIDFDKFRSNYATTQTQTDKQNNYIYGLDSQKLIKSFQDKQNELQLIQKQNQDYEHENKILKLQIQQLIIRLRREESEHQQKIDQLKAILQKTKALAKQSMCQTQKKQNGVSLFQNEEALTKRKVISDLINLQLEDAVSQPIKQDHQTSIQELSCIPKAPDLLRLIYCQAVTVEQFLKNHREKENTAQS